MAVMTIIRYAGIRYLDRTAALESGEILAHGARLALRFTATAAESLALLRAEEVDCAEVPLATIVEPDFAAGYVALPVFPNRSFVTRNLVGPAPIDSASALAGATVALPAEDPTLAAWGKALITTLLDADAVGVTWTSVPSAELAALVRSGGAGFALVPYGVDRGGLVPVLPPGTERAAHDLDGVFPILSVVVLRRAVYAPNRWLAVSLTDAFVEAKAKGTARHLYFGALSVILPWLMPAIEDVRARFGGDAYRYGLGANTAVLERFARFARPSEPASRPGAPAGADLAARFAPEARSHPGVPDETFYAVPLSHVQ